MRKVSQMLLASFACFFLISCEDDEKANLYKAQDCLNKATQATANSCLIPIAGMTSEKSFVIRCSIAFLDEGIDEIAIVTALKDIDGKTAGVDPTNATIAALAMSTADKAANAFSQCSSSGSQSLTALAGFSQISTILGLALGGLSADPTAAEIDNLINNYDPNSGAATANKEALGNAVIASQDSLCNAKTGLLKDTPACKDIAQAIAANPGAPSAIADALIGNIDNQTN